MTIKALVLPAVASILADVIAKESLGFVPIWLTVGKILLLTTAALYYARARNSQMARYSAVLAAIVVLAELGAFIGRTPGWQGVFDLRSFTGYFGGAIFLKFLSTIPLVGLMFIIFDTPKEAYLAKGDLSVKAEPVKWLGIHPDWISWGRLSVVSAFMIAGGTLLLTLFTVTSFSLPETAQSLPDYIPVILLFALINSLSEGFMFRNAILGSLKDMLPKDHVLLIAAAFFGMAHFYGAPSGVVGVFMSGLLGWYMSRSMYETGGLVSAWIIHFMQDVVIFAMLLMTGTFI